MAARRYEIYLRVLKNIFQHEKKNFVFPSDHVIFCLLYRIWRSSEDFRPFSEDFRRFSKTGQNAGRTFPNISGHFPMITEDCRRRPKKIRRGVDHTPTNLSLVKGSKHHSSGTDIFTCEDIISSHVRISYRLYQFVTTRYTTDFYIIKPFIFFSSIWAGRMPKSSNLIG